MSLSLFITRYWKQLLNVLNSSWKKTALLSPLTALPLFYLLILLLAAVWPLKKPPLSSGINSIPLDHGFYISYLCSWFDFTSQNARLDKPMDHSSCFIVLQCVFGTSWWFWVELAVKFSSLWVSDLLVTSWPTGKYWMHLGFIHFVSFKVQNTYWYVVST